MLNKCLLPWEVLPESYENPFKHYNTISVRRFLVKKVAVEIRFFDAYFLAFVGLSHDIFTKYYSPGYKFISAGYAQSAADAILQELGYKLLPDHYKVIL